MSGQLHRLVLDFRSGELVVRCLYRSQDGPNPRTKARRRQVSELAREGLRGALEALEGDADLVGTSVAVTPPGFSGPAMLRHAPPCPKERS